MSDLQSTQRRYLLRELNIFGFDHLDPIILAALADERPLLLIGAHGTAKSELLNRLATALDLEHRHYNASLISFDDLLGYPVPNEARDGLQYLRTPGDLWDAESVFLDEISRCRPETQNKLFSVIHERRVQGMPLEKLRYRWAAMNPPVASDGNIDADEDIYLGSLPLDPALADRFPYLVTVPQLLDISVDDRRRMLARGGQEPDTAITVQGLVNTTSDHLASLSSAERDWAAAWMDGLTVPLHEAHLNVSGRRAVSLVSTTLSVYAACGALGLEASLADAAWLALKWGLPHRALGRSINEAQLRAAHRIAERAAGEPADSPWRAVRAEPDPVRRISIALQRPAGAVGRLDLSQLVQDALAGLAPAERHALAVNLMPVFAGRDLLSAPAYELLADLASPIIEFAAGGPQSLQVHRNRAAAWDAVLATVSSLEKAQDPLLPDIGNLLYALFAMDEEPFNPTHVSNCFRTWRSLFVDQAFREAA